MADGAKRRPETGNMRFGGDWAGVFIRSDDAERFATALESLGNESCAPFTRSTLKQLRDLLTAAVKQNVIMNSGLVDPVVVQEAVLVVEKADVIQSFTGRYDFMSNFFIEPDGTHVEGEYQATKCVNPADRARLVGKSPSQAKRIGRQVALVPQWKNRRQAVMLLLLRKKYHDHADLADRLIATYPKRLVEGNWWGDTFWGVSNGEGENWLGRLTEMVREELMIERGLHP